MGTKKNMATENVGNMIKNGKILQEIEIMTRNWKIWRVDYKLIKKNNTLRPG